MLKKSLLVHLYLVHILDKLKKSSKDIVSGQKFQNALKSRPNEIMQSNSPIKQKVTEKRIRGKNTSVGNHLLLFKHSPLLIISIKIRAHENSLHWNWKRAHVLIMGIMGDQLFLNRHYIDIDIIYVTGPIHKILQKFLSF